MGDHRLDRGFKSLVLCAGERLKRLYRFFYHIREWEIDHLQPGAFLFHPGECDQVIGQGSQVFCLLLNIWQPEPVTGIFHLLLSVIA